MIKLVFFAHKCYCHSGSDFLFTEPAKPYANIIIRLGKMNKIEMQNFCESY